MQTSVLENHLPQTINIAAFDAVILDMDGVITQTALLHARAWKKMFDTFLKSRQQDTCLPLDIAEPVLRAKPVHPGNGPVRNRGPTPAEDGSEVGWAERNIRPV